MEMNNFTREKIRVTIISTIQFLVDAFFIVSGLDDGGLSFRNHVFPSTKKEQGGLFLCDQPFIDVMHIAFFAIPGFAG